MAISFNLTGQFKGVVGGSNVLSNPTSLQFGPDGRLYVAEQNGTINAFTVTIENGEYVATAHEALLLPNGSEVVKSIQNHNDDGSPNNSSNRQVTGLVVTGTAENPVLYISSSDPRIATNKDSNLDTNSGVITRVTRTGTEWEAVDIIRGLPRSEENHSVNGMVLSADGSKLYLAVGGNTNNGAPSKFFAYTGEYALSGTVLEIDINDINSRPILTDPAGGQNGASRQYVYDLPTLDDPSVDNNGVREDQNGMDVAGPWGGNDGFNMAILPADAPLRIYADGFRNHYDLTLTEAGKLYTVDNGSNGNLGGDPVFVNGEATNQPNNGGSGDPEPLFLIEEGGYYGHPAPVRSNQDLPWTVYNNNGNPDTSLSVNSVSNLANWVPDAVNIQDGFVIDPSQFTGNSARLQESGIRIERDSAQSNTLVNIGSSSNGLTEYTGNAFGGALKGDLLVAQFNGNIGRLDLNADGTAATYETINGLSGLSTPLDVTIGPNGTVWVAEIGGDYVKAYAPSDLVLPDDPDFDGDGLINKNDPFIRDDTNGGSVLLFPGQTLLWDFDANQDDNLPGPDGYGGGLTGVMIDGVTNFEEFFQEPSTLEGQNIKLDNVKFITAAGGGTTVVENVSNGDPLTTSNNGEYLFHTGVTISPMVDAFTIKWSVYNPAALFSGSFQQIGGYIGTGDQSNYLKIAAIQSPDGEIQIALEEGDVLASESFIQADDLFDVPDNQKIFLELEIDPEAATANPTITYETGGGNTKSVSGGSIDLSGTKVLDAIKGDYVVQGLKTGLAVGLFSTNTGQPEASTFQAIFDDIEISATDSVSPAVLYRVNAGGQAVAALDGGPDWSADTSSNNSLHLTNPGSNDTASFTAVEPGSTVPASTPGVIFDTERWDSSGGSQMQWAFDVPQAGLYEVRLYMGNGYSGTSDPGERVFDVALEGNVFGTLDDIDLSGQFGHQVGTMVSNMVSVTDGTLNIEFLHGIENPLINGIEIIRPGSDAPAPEQTEVSIAAGQNAAEPYINGQFNVSLSEAVSTDTVVAYTVTGTATPDGDYTALSGTVTIPAGELSAPINVAVIDDQEIEGQENVTVTLDAVTSDESNVVLGSATTATVALDDNEAANEVTINSIENMAEPDSNGQFSVNLSEVASTNTVVAYTVTGTATPDGDYTALSGTVTIPAGELSAPINVAVMDDQEVEGEESVTVTLDNVTAGDNNVVLGVANAATVTIADNDVADASPTVLYRVNAGGKAVAALDGGPDWSADTESNNNLYLANPGSNDTASFAAVEPGSTVPASTPSVIFDTERWDNSGGSQMQWAFDVPQAGLYEVRLYMGNGYSGTSDPGERVFDVALEGNVFGTLDDIDLSGQFDHQVGTMVSNTVSVTDGTLNIEFLHGVENPLVNGIEIIQLGSDAPEQTEVSIAASQNAAEPDSNGQFIVSLSEAVSTDTVVVYTVAGTATPDGDYIALSGTVTIPAGELSAPINVAVIDDQEIEAQESVTVTLDDVTSGESNVVLGSATAATVALDDNEVANEVTINSIENVAEPDSNGQFSVNLSEAVSTDTVVAYTVTGTATPDGDYTALSGTVTIPAGELSAPINVAVIDDQEIEGQENVTVTLDAVTAGDSNVVLGATNAATVTIADDDVAATPSSVLYRVNAGGKAVAALDGGLDWSADTESNNSPYLDNSGSNDTNGFSAVEPGSTVPASTPGVIFDTERWDKSGGSQMQWAFDVPQAGLYEVRLYMGNGYSGTSDPGERVFDVALEGNVFGTLDDIDLSGQFGHQVGTMVSNMVSVTDGTLNIEFLHGVENPLVNGIEIIQLGSDTPIDPTVSIVSGSSTVGEDGSQVQISLATDVTVPSDETVNVTFEIVPGTATPEQDYEYVSGSASFDSQTGVYTDTVTIAGSSSDATFLIDILQDAIAESNEAFSVNITDVSPNAQIGQASASVTIEDDDTVVTQEGKAVFTVTLNSDDVQISNYGSNSFKIKNTGDKKIAKVELDVTDALYPDSVFDPFGLAGDTAAKDLSINSDGNTGVIEPDNTSYIGAGGSAGFEGIQLLFDENADGGFEPGETIGFSIDMDPNSVAGAKKSLLDAGANPNWDVGGISGAEIIGSTVTVTFTDGTTATGQLQGAGNQAGSQALISQNSPNLDVSLTVNGLGAGDIGTYDENGPSVVINGSAGQTARVVLTKGFIQPATNEFFNSSKQSDQDYAPQLQAQLDALAASDFPANNAAEFQTVDIQLTGEAQDISNLFDFSDVANYDFEGEERLPLGFVASVIDPTNDDLPIGSVTQPIYLEFAGTPIRLEAEQADNVINYRPENISGASGNQVLGFEGGSANETGSATFGFNEASGNYNIIVGTFDENDGVAQFVVELNDVETNTTTEIGTLELNANLGSAQANTETFVSPTVAFGVNLTPGDSITVNGFEDAGEPALLDYVEFVPVL